ncbi:MAG: ADP-ribosylglycohydrolase family protein [Clostridia bacterium]|nr:ADP-ribosylglycohydrolase family protein [Clostridia bacterium]
MEDLLSRIKSIKENDIPLAYKLIDHTTRHEWEAYSKQLRDEYRQCESEGLEIQSLKPAFEYLYSLEPSPLKAYACDLLFEEILKLPTRSDYPYREPNAIDDIRAARPGAGHARLPYDADKLRDKLAGAWYGRICGCLAGKTVEGIRTEELIPFLEESGNYPMHRYILSSDLPSDYETRYKFHFKNTCYADRISCAPTDDDTNYTCLYQQLIEKYGRGFTPSDVCSIWLTRQPVSAYCTAERAAYCNMIKGLRPPYTASFQNSYREWIGAQIRADYFGYINPGDPEAAADMAYMDACISHTKNGIYGEMFVSAMIAAAAADLSIPQIIDAGLNEIPASCRLQAQARELVSMYTQGLSCEDAFRHIHTLYDEHTGYGWCHTISNALIVIAALLYGNGDYGKSICLAVQTGFDTDCNGATVGSIIGMLYGRAAVGEEWTRPLKDELSTSIIGVGKVKIPELIETTLKHIGI